MADLKQLFADAKEAFKELKDVFEKTKFTDLKLEDGSIVRIDTDVPQKGSAIKVLDTTGAEIAIPDGQYTVVTDAGNVQITVAAGYITEATPTTQDQEPAQPNGEAQMNDEAMKKLETMVSEMGARLAAIEEKMGTAALSTEVDAKVGKQGEDLKQAIADVLAKFSAHEKFSKDLFALVEKLGEVQGEATQKPADKTDKKQSPAESIAQFRKTQKL